MPNLCVLCGTTGSYGGRPLCFEHYKKGENLDNLPDTWQPKELVMNEIFSLKAFQAEQREWSLRNFGESYGTGYRALLGAGEEMGELFHSHLKAEQGIRTNKDHKANMIDAIADVIIYLADYCNGQGIDLEDALRTTWAQVRQRDWLRNKETGDSPKI